MKRKTKTLMAFIIAIVFCMNSAVIATAEGETSGNCGDGVTWNYDADTKTLIISGNGEMQDYTSGADTPWYSFDPNINSIVIESGVTRIGERAFTSLQVTEITLSDTVEEIGIYAFFGTKIITVDIPSSVKVIEQSAFQNCSSLKTVILHEGLEELGQEALDSAITSLSPVPKSVKSIGRAAFLNVRGDITILNKDCEFPSLGSSSLWSYAKIYCFKDSTTEAYLLSRNYTNYVIICLDGTENHKFEKTSTTATCTQAGTATMTCSVCGTTKEEDEEALGHSFTNYISDGNATCTADGTKTAQCDNGCGETDTVTDEGSMTEHTYEETVIAPTCIEQGYTEYKCKDCGDTYKSDYVDELGHTPETVIVKEAQIGIAGLQQEKCSVCGEILSETQLPALEEATTEAKTTEKKTEETTSSTSEPKTTTKQETETQPAEKDNSFKTDYSLFRVVGGVECAKVAVVFDDEISGYEVFVSDGSGFKNSGEIKDKTENYLVLLNLKSDCNYRFKLKAYKINDVKKIYADEESKIISVRIN